MSPNREQVQIRVAELMEDLFGVDASQIRPESSPDTIPEWNSLKHIGLIAALEEEFGIQLGPEEMSEMLSVDIILDILEESLNRNA